MPRLQKRDRKKTGELSSKLGNVIKGEKGLGGLHVGWRPEPGHLGETEGR